MGKKWIVVWLTVICFSSMFFAPDIVAGTEQNRENASSDKQTGKTLDQMPISYESASADILMQYVTEDQKKVKLLNNNILYSYDISTGLVTTEHTFDTSEYKQGDSIYLGTQSNPDAFIREDVGLLYYGYNCYENTYSDEETMNIVVYDLNTEMVKDTFSVDGYILKSVGADKKGNIYIGTDDCTRDESNRVVEEQSLIILSASGDKLQEKSLSYPINGFSGFCADGTFYYIDEYMGYSALGYGNLMGRLMRGSYSAGSVELGDKYLTYAKNIYFADYRNPVEIINDTVLVTSMGAFYPLDQITDSTFSQSLYAEKNLEMGAQYDYLYNAGVSTVIKGDLVYTLYDNKTIFGYSMSTGEKKKVFYAKNKIFNLKGCGDDLIALETDGTTFSYEQVPVDSFRTVTTKTYNMNDFSVYQGRTKAQIEEKFKSALPADMNQTLYQSVGSASGTYKESTLTAATRKNAVTISNYYRWLAGLTGVGSSSDDIWTRAGKGAVLLASSDFSHNPDQPSDMPDDFYKEAVEGTGSSNIAMNYYADQYKLVKSIRQFLDDTGYTVPGHRNTFFTRNATNIAYGIHGAYMCQTVEYTGDPNPSGTAEVGNNEMAYAWPAAGAFPAEELSPFAYWTVCLNTDKLNLSGVGLVVTVEDQITGEKFVRESKETGLYTSKYWGYYVCFAPPELPDGVDSYAGRKYRVTFSNLSDADSMPAVLTYTIDFFQYSKGILPEEEEKDTDIDIEQDMDSFIEQKVSYTLSNSAKGVKISWKKISGADSYSIYRDGKLIKTVKGSSYVDTGAKKNGGKYTYYLKAAKGKKMTKKSVASTWYYMSRPSIKKLQRLSGSSMKVTWKKNAKASGYQIKYITGSKVKTVNVAGGKKVRATLRKLKKKKVYKVYLRCYKKVGKTKYYSAWSKKKVK